MSFWSSGSKQKEEKDAHKSVSALEVRTRSQSGWLYKEAEEMKIKIKKEKDKQKETGKWQNDEKFPPSWSTTQTCVDKRDGYTNGSHFRTQTSKNSLGTSISPSSQKTITKNAKQRERQAKMRKRKEGRQGKGKQEKHAKEGMAMKRREAHKQTIYTQT